MTSPVCSWKSASRKLRRAETSHDPREPIAPSATAIKPPMPAPMVPCTRSLRPGRMLISATDDMRSPKATENPPISSELRSMSPGGRIDSAPPLPPCRPKWFTFGRSNPSMRIWFSSAPPPRTSRSFRLSCDAATPGCDWNARDTSSSAPGVAPMDSPVMAGAMAPGIGVASSALGMAARASACIWNRYGTSTVSEQGGPPRRTANGADSVNPSASAVSV